MSKSRESQRSQMPGEWAPNNLLSLLIHDYAKSNFGTQEGLAERVGMHAQTVSRWVRGHTKPTTETIAILSPLLGRSPEFLTRVGKMTLSEACDIIETYDALYDPVGAARQKVLEQRRQDTLESFLVLVEDRQDTLPLAAYAIFLTGDDTQKEGLVQVLDAHPHLGTDTPPATLNLVLDLHLQVTRQTTGERNV